MKINVNLNSAYAPSDDVVAREIEGEIIIVPLVAGIGDMEDELYTLNQTGKAILDLLDGKRDLQEIVAVLTLEYDAAPAEIEQDVLGIVAELFRRRMLIDALTL